MDLPPKLPKDQRQRLSLLKEINITKSSSSFSESSIISTEISNKFNQESLNSLKLEDGKNSNDDDNDYDDYADDDYDDDNGDDDVNLYNVPLESDRQNKNEAEIDESDEEKEDKVESEIDIFTKSDYTMPKFIQSLDQFRSEIFKNESNKLCADCVKTEAEWVSCRFFITLCTCCAEIHLKLPHVSNKFYVIEINKLYSHLSQEFTRRVSLDFIKIFYQTGNEKMNSLFEFQTTEADLKRSSSDMKSFITEKYLNKSFINPAELWSNENCLEKFNKILSTNRINISIIIYNLFLGANLNYSRRKKTIADRAKGVQTQTETFLKFNDESRYYEEIDKSLLITSFSGECDQIDVSSRNQTIQSFAISSLPKITVFLKLEKDRLFLIQPDQETTTIPYRFIIRILTHTTKSLIEIKWFNRANKALVSTYLKYTSETEQQVWTKQFFQKLLYTKISEDKRLAIGKDTLLDVIYLSDYCQVSLCGFLYAETEIGSGKDDRVFAGLLYSDQKQNGYFRKVLVLVKNSEPLIELIDLRKPVVVVDNETFLSLNYLNKLINLKTYDCPEILKDWFDKIQILMKMNFTCIDDQYLTRDSVPILIEKTLSFIELNLVLDPNIYLISSLPQSTPKLSKVYDSLLKEKNFYLQATSETIVFCLRRFFKNYINKKHSEFFRKAFFKKKDLKIYLNKMARTSPTFYHTLKRLCIHMNLVSQYSYKNDMSTLSLANFISSFLFNLNNDKEIKEVNSLLETLIKNCTEFFNLESTYLKKQLDIIEKYLDFKRLKLVENCTDKFLVTVFYEEKSCQLKILKDTTCKEVMVQAKEVLGIGEAKYLNLFEVLCRSKTADEFLMERPLTDDARLIMSLAKWESFDLRVKMNSVQMECERTELDGVFRMEHLCEECEMTVGICGEAMSRQTKWKKRFLGVEDGIVKIFKKNVSSRKSGFLGMSVQKLETPSNPTPKKPCHQIRLDESLIIYYGLYQSAADPDFGFENFSSESTDLNNSYLSSSDEVLIKPEECLTFYLKELKKEMIYCFNFKSKSVACKFFMNITKKVNSMSCSLTTDKNNGHQSTESFVKKFCNKFIQK